MFQKKYIIPIVFAILNTLCHQAQAQKEKPYNEEITVVAAFKPEISDAFKINQNPTIVDTTSKVPVMTFDIRPRPAQIQLGLQPIEASKLTTEHLPVLLRNYARVGLGNYLTSYAELFTSTLRNKNNLLNFRVKHLGSNAEIKDFAKSITNEQLVELGGKHFFPNHILSGQLDYNRNRVSRYGYNPNELDSLIQRTKYDTLDKQRFQRYGAAVNFASNYSKNDQFNHSAGFSFYQLNDLYKSSETNFKFNSNVNKGFDLFNMPDLQVLGLNVDVDHYKNKLDSISLKYTTVNIIPYMDFAINEFLFHIGLNSYVETDSSSQVKIYPSLKAELNVIPAALQVYLGLDGSLKRNTLAQFSSENPFISSNQNWLTTYNVFHFFGGLKSNISKTVSLNAAISYKQIENLPFFITDSLAPLKNTFIAVYDDVNFLTLSVDAEFVQSEKMVFSLSGNYYNYALNDLEHPWYKPDYDLSFGGRYYVNEKIILKAKLKMNGAVWALAPTDNTATSHLEAQKLKGALDLSLGGEYRFTKHFSAWLNLNNITNSMPNIWWNYPTYGINVLAGVSFGF